MKTYVEILNEMPKERLIDTLATIKDMLEPIPVDESILDDLYRVVEHQITCGYETHEGTGEYNSMNLTP